MKASRRQRHNGSGIVGDKTGALADSSPSIHASGCHASMPVTSKGSGNGALPDGAPPLSDAHRQRLDKAFEAWRRKLLDLTKRNRALNYKVQAVGSVTISGVDPTQVYRKVVGEESVFSFRSAAPAPDAAPVVGGPESPYVAVDRTTNRASPFLPTAHPLDQLDHRLRRVAEIQRTSLEEQGVNTIYLGLGFLHYTEADHATTVLRAPLVMVPVTLKRGSAREGYTLRLGEDEPLANPSLIEYMRRERRVVLPQLPEPNEESASWDLEPYYRAIEQAIAGQQGWQITKEIELAAFAFAKLVMYKDLEEAQGDYIKHPMVQRLVLRSEAQAVNSGLPADVLALDLDRDYPPERAWTVLDADSTQLRSIAAVERGTDLVIHGPPGTGKSQTITNLIAQALATGKSVLFVSEKTAALEVVASRLKNVGLSSACLELHSTKSKKSEVLQGLNATQHWLQEPAGGFAEITGQLKATRQSLNEYVKAAHLKRTALEISVFGAVGHFAATHDAVRMTFPVDPTALTRGVYDELCRKLAGADGASRFIGDVATHGWRDSRLGQLTEEQRDTIARLAQQLHEAACRLDAEGGRIAEVLGLREPERLDEVSRFVVSAEFLGRSPGWSMDIIRLANLQPVIDEMRQVVTEGKRLAALEQRFRRRYVLEEMLEVDRDELVYVESNAGGLLGWLKVLLDGRLRSIKRRWAGMVRDGAHVSLLDQAADLRAIPKWKAGSAELSKHGHAPQWFGQAWAGAASDWKVLEGRVDWLSQFVALIAKAPLGDAGYGVVAGGGPREGILRGCGECASLERSFRSW
ncbi:MAG: DUF4011 domain-containing protein [Gemmatimonadetes bacterium]|nr:DUF4011 domain-containing protein [Gemmatimonadota bacterium]